MYDVLELMCKMQRKQNLTLKKPPIKKTNLKKWYFTQTYN